MNNLIWVQNHKSIQNTSQNRRCVTFIIVSSFFDLVKKLFSIEML